MIKLILVKPSEEYINEISDYRQEFIKHDTHSHGDLGLYDTEDIKASPKPC